MSGIKKKQTGFTIVELLIVIVVIGILAAITVVAYNGIQARAKIAATLSAVDGFEKILRMYKEVHGFYPESGGYACLGGPYPATAAIGAGKCWINPSATVALTRFVVSTTTVCRITVIPLTSLCLYRMHSERVMSVVVAI